MCVATAGGFSPVAGVGGWEEARCRPGGGGSGGGVTIVLWSVVCVQEEARGAPCGGVDTARLWVSFRSSRA